MLKKSRKKLYEQCEAELHRLKGECIGGLASIKDSLNSTIAGDAGDMSQAIEERHTATVRKEKFERQLREIEAALKRMETGDYGICEETGEDIEEKRLLAIPWTKFSVEGAEMRERASRQYASATEDSVFDEMTGSGSAEEE